MNRRMFLVVMAALMGLAALGASAQQSYDSWPLLRSTFESTGGGGIMIKGYDPVVLGNKCTTTFMAVTPAPDVKVYYNIVEFDAVATQGGTLCQNTSEKILRPRPQGQADAKLPRARAD